jgi:hypothetical protein
MRATRPGDGEISTMIPRTMTERATRDPSQPGPRGTSFPSKPNQHAGGRSCPNRRYLATASRVGVGSSGRHETGGGRHSPSPSQKRISACRQSGSSLSQYSHGSPHGWPMQVIEVAGDAIAEPDVEASPQAFAITAMIAARGSTRTSRRSIAPAMRTQRCKVDACSEVERRRAPNQRARFGDGLPDRIRRVFEGARRPSPQASAPPPAGIRRPAWRDATSGRPRAAPCTPAGRVY